MTKPKNPHNLDNIFIALGNHHRREIIYSLGLQPYSISQLASQRQLSLPAIHKHIKILVDAELVLHRKIGRTNFLSINRETLRTLQNWLMQYQTYWGNNAESLKNYEQFLKKKTSRKEVKKK